MATFHGIPGADPPGARTWVEHVLRGCVVAGVLCVIALTLGWLRAQDAWTPRRWIPAPPSRRIPSDGADHFDRWVTLAGSRFLTPADDPAGPKAAAIGRILRTLGSLDTPSWDPFWLQKWIHWPSLADLPTMVIVSGFPATGGGTTDELRGYCGEGVPGVLEEPIIEPVSSTRLGSGLRSLAYTAEMADGLAEVHATLAYVWRIRLLDDGRPTLGIVRLWASGSPRQIIAAEPDIHDLALTLRMETSG